MSWAKALPPARANLARSGIVPCPPALLRLQPRDFVTQLPPGYGYPPLRAAIGRRYRVSPENVLPVPGGTSLANYLACAAVLDGAPRGAEAIVEQPTYEPLLRIPEAFCCRVRRLLRLFEDGYAIDLDRFAALVTPRTCLAIVSNLHNPSGVRISPATLRRMASILRRVGAHLLVDEVYMECLFGARTESAVHAGGNVLTANSLTKAYGLDGLRAGWILGPARLVRRAGLIYDLMGVNGVAPGEWMTLAAFRQLPAIKRRARALLGPNLRTLRRFLAHERRLTAVVPQGGSVCFPLLPPGLDPDRLARHLRERYSTLIVPGRFFEAPRHIRVSFGCDARSLAFGLARLSRALNDLLG